MGNLSGLYKTLRSRKTRLLRYNFVMWVSVSVTIFAILHASHGISTKMDFGEDSSSNSSSAEDDNVEVKHTIVVSTKLNNRRGLHSNAKGETGALTYNIGRRESTKDDSGEVPILTGYKALETTQIRTPDTRNKPHFPPPTRSFQPPQVYTESVFINRNIRDDDDIFPNIAINPSQWKPSSFFNNINNRGPDLHRDSNFIRRMDHPVYHNHNQAKLNRRITEDGMKEFYCRKCIELNCPKAPIYPQPRTWVTTTPKMKLDGKLAKLN